MPKLGRYQQVILDKKKKEAYNYYITGKFTLRQLARMYEVSATTLHSWVKDMETKENSDVDNNA